MLKRIDEQRVEIDVARSRPGFVHVRIGNGHAAWELSLYGIGRPQNDAVVDDHLKVCAGLADTNAASTIVVRSMVVSVAAPPSLFLVAIPSVVLTISELLTLTVAPLTLIPLESSLGFVASRIITRSMVTLALSVSMASSSTSGLPRYR